MKLEDQVTSLELSKILKELGIKQESLFCYQPVQNENDSVWTRNFNLNEFCNPSKDERIAAFTVAELGEMLPDNCYTQKDCGNLPIEWYCHRMIDKDQEDIWNAETEADARAKMLIYLLENKLI